MFDFIKNELFFNLGRLFDSGALEGKREIICCGLPHYSKLSISWLIGAGIDARHLVLVDMSQNEEDIFLGVRVTREIEKCTGTTYSSESIFLISIKKKRGKELSNIQKSIGDRESYIVLERDKLIYRVGSKARRHMPDLYNDVLNNAGYHWYRKKHQDIDGLTRRNVILKDSHRGEKCFILGNGPSLQQFDLKKIAEEYVFGVNQIMSADKWDEAMVNAWVCIDGNLLGMWINAQYDFCNMIKRLNGLKICAFVPVEARHYLKSRGLLDDTDIDFYYLNAKQQYINFDNEMHIEEIDISKFMMQSYNVVICAINIAIYMGFSEIYLLGCDQSVLKEELNYFFDEMPGVLHTFEGEDASLMTMQERMASKGMYFEIKAQLTQLKQFSLLADYCERKGIRIRNLTKQSLKEGIIYEERPELYR